MIICPNCSYENIDGSKFCQDCGNELQSSNLVEEQTSGYIDVWTCDYCGKEFSSKKLSDSHERKCLKNPNRNIAITKIKKAEPNSIYEKLNDSELGDVIFTPKKKKSGGNGWITFGVIGIVLLFIFLFANSYSSNNSLPTSTTTQTTDTSNSGYFSALELSYLKLEGGNMTGNSYYEPNPSYEVTIHNAGSLIAKNIILRINFYKADDTGTNATPQDTQYLRAVNFLAPGDSTHVNSIIKTAFNTSGRFRWYAEVYSAEK